jgi:hypothetical protein
MSRSSSNDKNKKDLLSSRLRTKNIFQSSVSNFRPEEIDPNLLMRKRSERQASQGVKLLVNRERGINSEMQVDSPTVMMSGDNTPTQENKRNLFNHPSASIGSGSNYQPTMHGQNTNSISHSNSNVNNSHHSQAQGHAGNTPQNPGQGNISHLHQSQMAYHQSNVPKGQIFSRQSKDDKILNRGIFEKLLVEKLKKEGLEVRNINEISNFMNIGLETYLKNVLEKLISTSRIRNVNLNLYSKQSERNPVFQIHTFNLDRIPAVASNNSHSQAQVMMPNTPHIDIGLNPYKDFSIVFTKNMKNAMNMLEQYEELNLKKLRQERVSMYKSKLEEISALKEKEKEEKSKDDKSTALSKQGAAKPRVRKRDSMLKNVRNTLAKSQKRDEMARHKKETQNTLETFLDNRPKNLMTSTRFDTEMVSNKAESHNLETFTKMSELSKSEAQGIGPEGSNDINLTVFKYYTPSQNIKLPQTSNIRRRITLKDLIHFLEGERKTPLQNLILHRAIIKLNQSSH